MKVLGLVFGLAVLAAGLQLVRNGQPAMDGAALAGIDAGGEAHSDCLRPGEDRLSGCQDGELGRIVVAGIHAGGRR